MQNVGHSVSGADVECGGGEGVRLVALTGGVCCVSTDGEIDGTS